ncbi:MerR family DNA-binding transcriptional regulator [Nocardia sp. KC 131]|uniref:MerR family DNA-binding transcriptional regulator n=1 Tax=Nocardia arseniciresistens TaxID=3392119 RepID=UPI00398E7DA5
MGRAAEILGVTQAFLRGLDAAELLTPQRSAGGHRRYSRYQLRPQVDRRPASRLQQARLRSTAGDRALSRDILA